MSGNAFAQYTRSRFASLISVTARNFSNWSKALSLFQKDGMK